MSTQRRLLLVTYYWPPSGGPGVQRWLKMVKYLVRLGWEVTVYTPSNPEFSEKDPSLLKDVPDGVRILSRKIIEPLRAYRKFLGKKRVGDGLLAEEGTKKKQGVLQRLLLWLRANLFVPDARCLWIRPSVRFLTRWLTTHPHEVMVTTGPPHSMHLIGRGVHRRTGIRWVADFRDPWRNIDYHQHLPFTSQTRGRIEAMERSVVEEANGVVVVTEGMRADFAAYHAQSLKVIYNGFDTEDFPTVTVAPLEPETPLRIVYAGSMNADRNPSLLWGVLQELSQEGRLCAGHLRVELFGRCDVSVKSAIADCDLDELVEVHGSIAHAEVPALLCGADLLLLCINRAPTSQSILTGKVFEYLASRRPIIAIAPTGSEVAALLAQTASGRAFADSDKQALKTYLLECLARHQRGERQEVSAAHLAPYTREYQARQFEEMLL